MGRDLGHHDVISGPTEHYDLGEYATRRRNHRFGTDGANSKPCAKADQEAEEGTCLPP